MTQDEVKALISTELKDTVALTGTRELSVVANVAKQLGNGEGYYTPTAYMRTMFGETPEAVLAYLTEEEILLPLANKDNRALITDSLNPKLTPSGSYALNPKHRLEDSIHNSIFRPASIKGEDTNRSHFNSEGQRVREIKGFVSWFIDANNEETEAYFTNILRVEIPKKIVALAVQLRASLKEHSTTNDLDRRAELSNDIAHIKARQFKLISKEVNYNFKPLSDIEAYAY